MVSHSKRKEDFSEGRLAPCPDRPNCVASQAQDPRHAIAPLRFSGSADDAMARLHEVLSQQARCRIVRSEGRYLRAEFRSLVFRFVDDVEFLVDEAEHVIHFRSASRLGFSDLGVNRARMEHIRRAFAAATSAG
ncbi:MAG: DUF1499 domain-containing protein [Pirellulaceae bacterium]